MKSPSPPAPPLPHRGEGGREPASEGHSLPMLLAPPLPCVGEGAGGVRGNRSADSLAPSTYATPRRLRSSRTVCPAASRLAISTTTHSPIPYATRSALQSRRIERRTLSLQ